MTDDPVDSQWPVENAFGVPQTLAGARLRLPTGVSAQTLCSPADVNPPGVDRSGIEWFVADTVLWTWDDRALGDLADTLSATGARLAFVEPTAGLGLRQRILLVAGRWLPHRFERDIPAELRRHGLVVTTAVRFRDRYGSYVWGEARTYDHPITTR